MGNGLSSDNLKLILPSDSDEIGKSLSVFSKLADENKSSTV